jgi:hypothetical protein
MASAFMPKTVDVARFWANVGVLPLVDQDRGQVAVADGGVEVVLAPGSDPDRQGAAVHRLGLGGLPLVTQDRGQVVVA